MSYYFFIDSNGQQQGPVAIDQLMSNGVTPASMVWCEGMADWQRASEVEELNAIFNPGQNINPNNNQWNQPLQGQGMPYGNQPYQNQGYGQGYPNQQYANPNPQYGGYNPHQGMQPNPYSQNTFGNQPNQPAPSNYMIWSVLTLLFCCLPFGIIALIYSSKVDGLWSTGRYEEAIQAANNAKKWNIISAVCGIVGTIIYIIFYAIYGMALMGSLQYY